MTKLWKYAFFLVGIVALVAYWELNHPLSYSKYRSWVSECAAEAAKANSSDSTAKPANCSISYDDWTRLVIPNAATRDPALSEQKTVKK